MPTASPIRPPGPRGRLRERRALRALPTPVRGFYRQALRVARRTGDGFSLASASRPAQLSVLLDLARGRHTLVELGTCTAWTAIALALAEPAAAVATFDPVVHAQRDAYLALVLSAVRARIDLVTAAGAEGAGRVPAVDLLFVDSTHERAATVAEYRAWRPRLAPGAVVVFDDYGHPDYPGVAEAIADLGLTGTRRGGLYVVGAG